MAHTAHKNLACLRMERWAFDSQANNTTIGDNIPVEDLDDDESPAQVFLFIVFILFDQCNYFVSGVFCRKLILLYIYILFVVFVHSKQGSETLSNHP